ncbi:sigma-70 family RNA polymerase sigma factor [Dissulfurirhabdus thermomarina]|uniref:Sigma-70 family RNA polymerase sigma factor n=1 Tax=Dissulfurirhabdus thermomarina TaxID=1765737 RepID=A0A6N9TSI5_DISTH|nr:sigma-70 family RNA polymerase sigma factor [Dissulfurirhabdus thermomarina]NDY42407.1 sigma-70 family RNA polymerase sigma factor [Dissulfurirhabdus thermomarina]NMX23823.1 sigma-70 family RNA polymerase sigma factor [Dissulfurirhabdus thermomarina]
MREPGTQSEERLLARVAAGDEAAFRDLYERTHRRLYYYLLRLLADPSDAEDVLVETFTEVWRCAKKFRGRSRATTWMVGIGRNLAMNRRRRTQTHVSLETLADPPGEGGVDLAGADRRRVLRAALARLSPKHWEVLDLVFYQGLHYREAAEVLSIPENTVKTRVFYAKDALRKALAEMGVRRDDL